MSLKKKEKQNPQEAKKADGGMISGSGFGCREEERWSLEREWMFEEAARRRLRAAGAVDGRLCLS